MTIFTGDARTRSANLLSEFTAPTADVLGAAAEEAWLYSPSSSIVRQVELERAMGRAAPPPGGGIAPPPDFEQAGPTSPIVSVDQARERISAAGLDLKIPDNATGIPEDALNILMQRKQEEMARKNILSRAPDDAGMWALRFGTALGVSLMDPLNVAAAFIPVIGPARYARLLEQAGTAAGRAAVRARVGALEGAVGAAIVEPIVYAAASAEQADYGMGDSLLNIALGTVLGGGLHMGAGAIGDAIKKGRSPLATEPASPVAERINDWSPQQRREALQISLSQALTGRQIDVDSWAQLRDAVAEVKPASVAEARRLALRDMEAEIREVLLPQAGQKLSREEVQQLQRERVDIEYKMETLQSTFKETTKQLQRSQKLSRKQAESQARKAIAADERAMTERRTRIDERLNAQATAAKAEADLSRLEQGIVPEQYRQRLEDEAQRRMDQGRFPEQALSLAIRQASSQPVQRLQQAQGTLKAAAVRQAAPEADPLANFEAADLTLQDLRTFTEPGTRTEAAQQMADEAEQSVKDLADQMELDVKEEIALLNEAVKQAETMGKAMRALATCQVRTA